MRLAGISVSTPTGIFVILPFNDTGTSRLSAALVINTLTVLAFAGPGGFFATATGFAAGAAAGFFTSIFFFVIANLKKRVTGRSGSLLLK